ncbi:hypothetical protein LVR30_14485 [Pantoea ananatis]|uniref:hypothetical protein n=3 Tax=Pantoea ananas TaxID=553 RepID=UPI0020266FA7|nr:hypothetical protein [Pantoea ananatis]URL16818.1 hypothetical protein LVR30_14485 [Pantoea ananatis]
MSRNEQRGCIDQRRVWRMSLKASEFRRLTAWWRVAARAPFHTTLHEMLEMRYLWQQPVRRENTQRVSFLGQEPHTLLEDAVRAALWLPAARSPKPEARSPKPEARSPKPEARSPKPEARSPKPEARSPKPEAQSPKPKAQSPKPTAGGVFVSPNRLQRRAAFPEH